MTDERLIEEAAGAIAAGQNVPFVGAKQRRLARAALAVFEKAHAPTGDEREALRLADEIDHARITGDSVDASSADVSRLLRTLSRRSEPEPQGKPSEVPEPSAEHSSWACAHTENSDDECPGCGCTCHAEPSRIGCNLCGEALPDGEPHLCSEPQGEPSDAQVDAALKGWFEGREMLHLSSEDSMRAALRAASAVGRKS